MKEKAFSFALVRYVTSVKVITVDLDQIFCVFWLVINRPNLTYRRVASECVIQMAIVSEWDFVCGTLE